MFKKLIKKIENWILNKEEISIGDLHKKLYTLDCEIYDDQKLKFIEETFPKGIYVKTPYGYSKIKHTFKTIKYDVYKIKTEYNELLAADNHILIDEFNNEIFLKDLTINKKIKTINGLEKIIDINKLDYKDYMYDLELNDKNHIYYTNNIVSHNSTTAAAFILWFTIFQFDKTVLIASNKGSNAMEMISRIQYAYKELPLWLKPGIIEGGWNKFSVIFDNESRITSTATSADSGRGTSISLLFLDEFAHVKPHIQENFWISISPTLTTGGACIISSTPNGDSELFSKIWRSSQVNLQVDDSFEFNPIKVKWNDPPNRDEEFKRKQISKIGEQKWLQEFECCFISSNALLINSLTISTLEPHIKSSEFKKYDFNFYDNIIEGEKYLIGVDPATGSLKDFTVIEIFHFPSLKQVAEFRSNTMHSPTVYNKLKNIFKLFEKNKCEVYFSIENNGVGEGIISLHNNDDEAMENINFISEDGSNRFGFHTTETNKLKNCIEFKKIIESGRMIIRSAILLNEIKTFNRAGTSYKAQDGSTDDCISASIIIIRILKEMIEYEQEAFDILYSYKHDDVKQEEDIEDENYVPDPIIY